MHLNFDMITATTTGESRHPQDVMRALGITYQHATPQSICDSWWFWNCQNVPAQLPPYLIELKVAPHDAIGHGLTKEMADRIAGSAA